MNTQTDRRLSDGIDFYKFPMGQVAFEKFPDAEVTFTLKNRAGDFPVSDHVDAIELEARLEAIRQTGFTAEEITNLAGIQAQDGTARFDEQYLNHLESLRLPKVHITQNPTTNDFDIHAKGPWSDTSLWETVVMSEVNELYFKNLLAEQGLTVEDVWAEGDRRLDKKIAILKERPDIKFADFGTRRRFSAAWQDHAVGRLAAELPDNLIGTSNPWLAYKHNLKPIGTYAHEMPMAYAALADQAGQNPLEGHTTMMHDWYDRYGEDLSIALTDTFTSGYFFSDFTPEQAEQWRGLRHDSGDPIAFGEQAIAFYEANNIDPAEKTIIFSDGLDIDTIVKLADHFQGRVNILFGWGTTLMNDLGFRTNNIVMKVTEVNGVSTVKLSDDEGKHTGPTTQVERYQALVAARENVNAVFTEMAAV